MKIFSFRHEQKHKNENYISTELSGNSYIQARLLTQYFSIYCKIQPPHKKHFSLLQLNERNSKSFSAIFLCEIC